MKRIVILCDGTWNRSDSETPTNVVRLAQAMLPVAPDGTHQVPVYVPGVGTGEGVTRLSRWADRVLGGALGMGLLENIHEAYRHLVFLYEPGDEIFIFGFSRGAYTARSLTGFIRSTGIVARNQMHLVPEAFRRYRTMDDPTTHPGTPESHAFRARLSPHVVTSAREAAWRTAEGIPEGTVLRIKFLGVWDSVGALGVPAFVPVIGRLTARRHRFHDASLSSMVQSARHAVALDEMRRAYAPTKWSNIWSLNARKEASGKGLYQEKYFAGDHGSVGGGGDIRALSSISLNWMIEGAAEQCLAFDDDALDHIRSERDACGPLCNKSVKPTGIGPWLTERKPKARVGPTEVDALHCSVVRRWRQRPDPGGFKRYRPASLERIRDRIATHVGWHFPPEV